MKRPVGSIGQCLRCIYIVRLLVKREEKMADVESREWMMEVMCEEYMVRSEVKCNTLQ